METEEDGRVMARVAPGRTKFQMVIDVSLLDRVHAQARAEERTMTAVVTSAVEEYLDRAA